MEQVEVTTPRIYSADEYLAFELASETRHELHDGVLKDMAGGTYEHSLITTNVSNALAKRLADGKCRVLSSDMRVRIGKTVNYYYPDLTVVCGPPQFIPPDKRHTLANPALVIEIASPSTEHIESRRKFYHYMRIDSLMQYMIVDQQHAMVETFYRQESGVWAIAQVTEGLESEVTLRGLGNIQIPLSEICDGIELIPSPPGEPAADPEV